MRVLVCGVVEGWEWIGIRVSKLEGHCITRFVFREFKLVTVRSCRRCCCWSIAVLASIVSKYTNQNPCHELGSSLCSVIECSFVAFLYEHKHVTVLPLSFQKQSVGLVEVDRNWLGKSINLRKSRRCFCLFLPGLASRVVRLMRNKLSSMARGL